MRATGALSAKTSALRARGCRNLGVVSYPDAPSHREYLRRYNTRVIGPDASRNYIKHYHDGAATSLLWDGEPGVRGEHAK